MDMQTGIYILEACREYSSNVAAIDIRLMHNEISKEKYPTVLLEEIKSLGFNPELIIVMKGLELDYDILLSVKNQCPKAKIVNWFFDKFIGDKPIWEQIPYYDTIRFYDYYFCSLKGVADRLYDMGFKNAVYLDEACSPEYNDCPYYNNFQVKKYGSDVAFCGTIGLTSMHKHRIDILEHIIKEGFDLKIWGEILNTKSVPESLKKVCMNQSVINNKHSLVCNSSLINIGIDQDQTLEFGHSARAYRVMCAGGLYVCLYVNGLEKMFKINHKGQPITEEQEMVVFYDKQHLTKVLDELLEKDELRKKIAENGQKCVLDKHTFSHRIKEMLEVIK